MKEKPVFFGSANWTVRTELIGAVEAATSDACYIGNFVRSNLVIDNSVGTASFEIYDAGDRAYARFCSALGREEKRLHEQELEIAAYKRNNPPIQETIPDSNNVIPFSHGGLVIEEEALEEMVAGA
jgi:hypothetical protein